jgi:cyclopropane-fatty-acyl-phospholipid synthase
MFDLRRKLEKAVADHQGIAFTVRDWDGKRYRAGIGAPRFEIHFRTRSALLASFLQPDLGFGEGYARGDIVIDGDLEEVLVVLVGPYLASKPPGLLSRWWRKLLVRTLSQEKNDIEHHYGLGDDFYRYYLDRNLQYSCGYFRSPDDSLDEAQEQKIVHTAAKLNLKPGQRLLDIGCGWGHLMFHAAEKYGVRCLGITLCDNQAAYIRGQAAARGLPVEVRVQNYQELDDREKWQRLVSVGMMCHVGEARANAYFDKVKSLLAPGGIGLLHCIAKMKESSGSNPFVRKYVFPGYWFFSLEGMTRRAVQRGLAIMDVENLRRHYALTAHHWRKNFLRNYDLIKVKMGFDDRFMRTWEFYLASVVTGFRTGQINLIQMVLSNGVNDDYPWTRDFLYSAASEDQLAETAFAVGQT